MTYTRAIRQIPIEGKNPSDSLKLAILNSLGSRMLWQDDTVYAHALAVESWPNAQTARAMVFLGLSLAQG